MGPLKKQASIFNYDQSLKPSFKNTYLMFLHFNLQYNCIAYPLPFPPSSHSHVPAPNSPMSPDSHIDSLFPPSTTHTHIYTYVCTHTQCIHLHIYTFMNTRINTICQVIFLVCVHGFRADYFLLDR